MQTPTSSFDRLLETFDALCDAFVDPRDALDDADGSRWRRLAGGLPGGEPAFDETQLAEIRAECRMLAVSNEFAINGHENRINFIVGSGHTYRAVPRGRRAADERLLAAVQAVLDEFIALNDWRRRQQEIVRRRDRDGECFIRLFPGLDGVTRVRFVEPDQVAAPRERAADAAASYGVLTEPDDVETVVGYFIDGRLVDAAEIQHRKANVDANVKRGLPLYFPVRKNLRRAEKLLRNMSVVSEIQSAIAIIRKHAGATAAGLEQFVRQQAETTPGGATGRTPFLRYAPGTILDAAAGTQYEFPAAGSDASNANYASTMVAEGPAVRMFARLQHDMLDDDRALLRRVLEHAVACGRLPSDALTETDIAGTAPSLASRDRLRDAQADRILVELGAMSIATLAQRHGLEPEHEERMRRA